jgi:two-component SAPR family response regulator
MDEVEAWALRAISVQDSQQAAPSPVTQELMPTWDEIWLIDPREELRMLRLSALEVTGQGLLRAGRFAEASRYARLAIQMDPLRESAARLLIEVHTREGNDAEALRTYRRLERRLTDAGCSPPGAEVRALLPGAAVNPGLRSGPHRPRRG